MFITCLYFEKRLLETLFSAIFFSFKFGINPKVGGFETPLGRDIFCLKNFDTFPRTPVPVSIMNAVARAQLTLQMSTLLKNIYTARASIQQHGTANVWP